MKRLKKVYISVLLCLILNFSIFSRSFANTLIDNFEIVEFSDNFLKWTNSSYPEQQSSIVPRMFDVPISNYQASNPLYLSSKLRASSTSRFTLKDVIPNNLVIRNQQDTNSCWAFSALSSLETNLALANIKSGSNLSKIYDFSERHMEYATSKYFLNNVLNPNGYNRRVGDGAAWYTAQTYLTNGSGPVLESALPFANNENLINISAIQNKTIAGQVYDTIDFPDYLKLPSSQASAVINSIKQHIQNNGSVFACIHGDFDTCYDNTTGAKYCSNNLSHPANHAVSIVGWDDNFNFSSLSESFRPSKNGAWIIRNSWGTVQEVGSVTDFKTTIFNAYSSEFRSIGIMSPADIPDSFITEAGYTISDGIVYLNVGDNGFMYVSYEDCNISSSLSGIVKASDQVLYDNIYQYDKYYPIVLFNTGLDDILISNVFDKQTNTTEYLTEVSLFAPSEYTCKVYVNPNGSSKSKSDLHPVTLKAGETETLSAGYHTLEFANPVEITGDSFCIAIEITNSSSITLALEGKIDGIPALAPFDSVMIESEKCFFTSPSISSDYTSWLDLSDLTSIKSDLYNGDSTIKAFTTNALYDDSVKDLSISTTSQYKSTYNEGENFDSSNLTLVVTYNSRTKGSENLNNTKYQILNGQNLQYGQTYVTATFQNKTLNIPITVLKNAEVPDEDQPSSDKPSDEGREQQPQDEEQEPQPTPGSEEQQSSSDTGDEEQQSSQEGDNDNPNPPTTPTVSSLVVITLPSKKQYVQNKDSLDLTGGVVRVNYSNNTYIDIPLSSSDITVSGFNNSKIGTITLTVKYNASAITTSFQLEIIAPDAQNSNFSKANISINKIQAYYYEDSKKDYIIIDLGLTGIINPTNATSVDYYYYLSDSSNKTNITDWVKIKNLQKSDGKFSFIINTKDISNYSEVFKENVIYLYVKEVVHNALADSTVISPSMKIEADDNIEVYIDDRIQADNPTPNGSEGVVQDDDTVAPGTIPQAGKTILFAVIILTISVTGILIFVKYKNLRSYIK